MDSVRSNSVQHSSQVYQSQQTQNTARNEVSNNNTSKSVFNPHDNVSLSAGSKYESGIAVSKYGIFVPHDPEGPKQEGPEMRMMYGVFVPHDPEGPKQEGPEMRMMYGVFVPHDPEGPKQEGPEMRMMYGAFVPHDPEGLKPEGPEMRMMYGVFVPHDPIDVKPGPDQPTPQKPDPQGPQMMYGAFPHIPGHDDEGGHAVPMYGVFHHPWEPEAKEPKHMLAYGFFHELPELPEDGEKKPLFPGIPWPFDEGEPKHVLAYGIFPKLPEDGIKKLGEGFGKSVLETVEKASKGIKEQFGLDEKVKTGGLYDQYKEIFDKIKDGGDEHRGPIEPPLPGQQKFGEKHPDDRK